MITLKTLEFATEQQVFDQVVNHLRMQAQQSLNSNGVCAYRGSNNLMCAAGCLIADDEYHERMDDFGQGKDWIYLVTAREAPEAHLDLIERLQNVHDGIVENWETGFQFIAEKFKLNYQTKENA